MYFFNEFIYRRLLFQPLYISVSSSLSALFFVFRVLLVFVVFCYSLLIIILLKERLVECQLLICLTSDISQTKKLKILFILWVYVLMWWVVIFRRNLSNIFWYMWMSSKQNNFIFCKKYWSIWFLYIFSSNFTQTSILSIW